MQIQIRDISPAIAEEMLATNADNNRRQSKTLIRQYARDMIAGNWEITGEAIKFDTNGRLIDGQHRLSAVIASKKTVKMAVITGLEPTVIHVLDTGRSRSGQDALTIAGFAENANHVAALARKIIGYQGGTTDVLHGHKIRLRGQPITNRDILEYARLNDLQPYVRFSLALDKRQINRIMAATEWAFVYWLLSQTDSDAAKDFCSRLATLDSVPLQSPIRTVFERLTMGQVRLTPKQTLMAIVTGWNAWRTGKELTRIKISNMDEEIPQPV